MVNTISWWGMVPYTLAQSSHTTVKSLWWILASCSSWVNALMCSTQPDTPEMSLFLTVVSCFLAWCFHTLCEDVKENVRLSHTMVQTCLMVLMYFFFRTRQSSASCQHVGTVPFHNIKDRTTKLVLPFALKCSALTPNMYSTYLNPYKKTQYKPFYDK